MIGGWLARLRAQRERRIVQRRAISEALWLETLSSLPFLATRGDADLAELRRLTSLFLDEKEFSGAGGLTVTDAMAVRIAVQACLPVLHIGLAPYRSFVGIVVHPDEVVAAREVVDDDGVVHNYDEVLSGEAMGGGPLMLSWTDVRDAGESADWAYNVVIHEFAHVLDMADGEADGVPPLASLEQRERWTAVLDAEYERFCRRVDAGRDTVLDPYGAEGIDEFFAVAVEAFFVAPQPMRGEHPKLYALFADYFQQDPAAPRR
ncbi:MAG TPA: M90 family metallopeptidase [Burkholderiaceae bacterium]|nr:M90 family metallopeptidase [Burkholderiaceae bacterium]